MQIIKTQRWINYSDNSATSSSRPAIYTVCLKIPKRKDCILILGHYLALSAEMMIFRQYWGHINPYASAAAVPSIWPPALPIWSGVTQAGAPAPDICTNHPTHLRRKFKIGNWPAPSWRQLATETLSIIGWYSLLPSQLLIYQVTITVIMIIVVIIITDHRLQS